jgi:hypothetical protein
MFSYHLNLIVDDALLALRGEVSIVYSILQILQRFENFHLLFVNVPIMRQVIFYPLVLYHCYMQGVQMARLRTLNTGQMSKETFVNVS